MLSAQLIEAETEALGFSSQQAQLLQSGVAAAEEGRWGAALDCYSGLLRQDGLDPRLVEPLQDKVRYFVSRLLPNAAPPVAPPEPEPVALVEAAWPAEPLRSQLCRQEDFDQPWFRRVLQDIAHPFSYHRKLWEYAYIVRALSERGLLQPGSRGLGFGVGREALVAYFAKKGCQILATDLDTTEAEKLGWVESNQHSNSIAPLFMAGLCDFDTFARQVEFRSVDMNHIPDDLLAEQFDFTWSTCSFEHVGSIGLGLQFIINQMRCLRPGGVAVHTTEFNLSSNEFTPDRGGTVLFRRRDIESLADALRAEGHSIELNFDPGSGHLDHYADVPPYFVPGGLHLKLLLDKYITTSIGLVIRKAGG